MNEVIDEHSSVREKIKWELRRLDKEEKALMQKESELKVYITYLKKVLDEVKKVELPDQLRDIINKGRFETPMRPEIFRMSRYFVEKEITQKLHAANMKLNERLEEIRTIRQQKKSANICPSCHGQGNLRETSYVREDGVVHPVLHVTTCPLCRGKGRISFKNS